MRAGFEIVRHARPACHRLVHVAVCVDPARQRVALRLAGQGGRTVVVKPNQRVSLTG